MLVYVSSDYLPMHSWPSLKEFPCQRSIANSLKFSSQDSFSLSCVSFLNGLSVRFWARTIFSLHNQKNMPLKKKHSDKQSVGHYQKWNILRNGMHLCSPLVCFYVGHRVGVMPPNSHSSCRMSKLVQEHILAHIGFFHTQNHIGSKSLTHRWKGEIKRINLHYFLAQESSIKADF